MKGYTSNYVYHWYSEREERWKTRNIPKPEKKPLFKRENTPGKPQADMKKPPRERIG